MTTPDPTPYLLPTDLRTAEDAARWLRSIVRDDDGALDGDRWPMEAAYASTVLDARLDRERRQACRRGALVWWRKMRICARRTPEWVATGWVQTDHGEWQKAFDALTLALAFRAAARAK